MTPEDQAQLEKLLSIKEKIQVLKSFEQPVAPNPNVEDLKEVVKPKNLFPITTSLHSFTSSPSQSIGGDIARGYGKVALPAAAGLDVLGAPFKAIRPVLGPAVFKKDKGTRFTERLRKGFEDPLNYSMASGVINAIAGSGGTHEFIEARRAEGWSDDDIKKVLVPLLGSTGFGVDVAEGMAGSAVTKFLSSASKASKASKVAAVADDVPVTPIAKPKPSFGTASPANMQPKNVIPSPVLTGEKPFTPFRPPVAVQPTPKNIIPSSPTIKKPIGKSAAQIGDDVERAIFKQFDVGSELKPSSLTDEFLKTKKPLVKEAPVENIIQKSAKAKKPSRLNKVSSEELESLAIKDLDDLDDVLTAKLKADEAGDLVKSKQLEARASKLMKDKISGVDKQAKDKDIIELLDDIIGGEKAQGRFLGGKGGKENLVKKAAVKELKNRVKKAAAEAKKKGISVADYLRETTDLSDETIGMIIKSSKNFSDESFLKTAETVVKAEKVDIKKGAIVSNKRTRELGEITEVYKTKKGVERVKVKFEETGEVGDVPVSAINKRFRKKSTQLRDTADPAEAAEKEFRRIKASSPNTERSAAIANEILEDYFKNPDTKVARVEDMKLVNDLADLIETKQISTEGLRSLLKDYNMTPRQLGKLMKDTASEAGRELNIWSQVSKKLAKGLFDDPDMIKEMGLDGKHDFLYMHMVQAVKKMETVYQASLITMAKTAVRNLRVSEIVKGLDIFSDVLAGTFNKISGSGLPGKEFTNALTKMGSYKRALYGAWSVAKRQVTRNKSLDKEFMGFKRIMDAFPIEKKRFMHASIADLEFKDRVTRTLTLFNNLQERYVRRTAFESSLLAGFRRNGMNLKVLSDMTGDQLKWLKTNSHLVHESMEYALKISFANRPVTPVLRSVVDTWREIPASSFAIPFMRFMTISGEWLARRSPHQFARLLNKGFRKRLFSINNETEVKRMADAFVGSTLIAAGFLTRNNKDLAGPKWYQVRVGTHPKTGEALYADTRTESPISAYLGVAELWRNFTQDPKSTTGENTYLTKEDYIEIVSGLRRLTGTPMAMFDIFNRSTVDEDGPIKQKTARKIFGQLIGGYTTFFRQFSDLYGVVDMKENFARSTKENPMWGPTLNNLPFLKQDLPVVTTSIEGELNEPYIKPAFTQVTGVTVQESGPFEQEYDRLGMYLAPKKGDPKVDRMVMKYAGPYTKIAGNVFVKTSFYKGLPDTDKKSAIEAIVENSRKEINDIINSTPLPELQEKRIRKERERIIKSIVKEQLP